MINVTVVKKSIFSLGNNFLLKHIWNLQPTIAVLYGSKASKLVSQKVYTIIAGLFFFNNETDPKIDELCQTVFFSYQT